MCPYRTGELTWAAEYDIYGKVRKLVEGASGECPFRCQGQYEDAETGLNYNRFRYCSSNTGTYLSQDPIGLQSGESNFYSYVNDSNSLVDSLGLSDSAILGGNLGPAPSVNHDAHHIVMAGSKDQQMIDLRKMMDKFDIGINDAENGAWLPRTDADRLPGDLSTAHKGDGIHGKAYKKEVYERLSKSKNRKEFLKELKKIKGDLHGGKKFPKCK